MNITANGLLAALKERREGQDVYLTDKQKASLEAYIASKRSNKSLLQDAALSYANFMRLLFEAVLFDYLRAEKFSVSPSKADGPDFQINFQSFLINIEAIAPDMQGLVTGYKETDDFESGIIQPQHATDRWLRSIKDKNEKYRSYLKSGLVSSGDINVIAVSNCVLEANFYLSFYTDPIKKIPHILECVYPVDNAVLTRNGYARYRLDVEGKNKISMRSGLFLLDEFTDIAAILGYNKETDNWVIVHNNLARNPLPHRLFNVQQEWVFERDPNIQSECAIRNLRYADQTKI